MLRGIIISSFKKWPRGLTILALLFLGTECFLYIIRPHIVTIFWNKFIINEHTLIDERWDFDYLLIGDSVQKTGIDPKGVSKDLLSLGLPGAKPQSLYILLRRYLKRHRPPKAIFLFIDPHNMYDAFFVILKYFVTIPEYISIWKDLSWKERFHFFMRYWVSLDERILSVPKRDIYPHSNSEFIRQLKLNRGFMPSPRSERSIEDDYFTKTNDRYEQTISIDERDFKYLDKLISLARANGIKVIFLGDLLPKELHNILEKTAFNRDFLLFLEIVRRRYPEVYIVDEPILYLENKYFGDPSHVNKEGSRIYTEYFKNRVFEPYVKMIEGQSIRNAVK